MPLMGIGMTTTLFPGFRVSVLTALMLALMIVSALAAHASEDRLVPAQVAGVFTAEVIGSVDREADGYRAEKLVFSDLTIDVLVAADHETPTVIRSWPVAPGDRHVVLFRPIDVYAPGAKLLATDGVDSWELQRSARVHLIGVSMDDPRVRVLLSIDGAKRFIRGVTVGMSSDYRLLEPSGKGQREHRMVDVESLREIAGGDLRSACGLDSMPWREDLLPRLPAGPLSRGRTKSTTIRQVTVAVDTDNEFNHKKFSNDTGEAADWIADLFAEMIVLYERDLDLRLLQGDTTFRLDIDPSPTYDDDPYFLTGSPADQSHLTEFGNYWSANMGSVDRTFAMLLSGKATSDTFSSGIAWVDGYCEKQSNNGGYSVTQVFLASWVSVSNDAQVIAHELGHNLGSPHTHCYGGIDGNPSPVDICFACENSCYSGTVSCPPGGQGTLMSYCHVSWNPPSCAATCGQNDALLHARVAAFMDGFVTDHTPWCVEVVDLDQIFTDGFESSDTTKWSSTTP